MSGTIVVVLSILLIAGVIGAVLYRNWRTRRLLGPVTFTATNQAPEMGETVGWYLGLNPDPRLDIKAITVVFLGYEWIHWTEQQTTGSGKNRRTRTVHRYRTHNLFHQSWPIAVPPPGDRRLIDASGESVIPRTGPPSMHAPDNRLIWELRLHIDLPWASDDRKTLPLMVQPVVSHPLEG